MIKRALSITLAATLLAGLAGCKEQKAQDETTAVARKTDIIIGTLVSDLPTDDSDRR